MQITSIVADGKTKCRIYLDDSYKGFLYNREVEQLGLCEGIEQTEEQWKQIENGVILQRGKKKALDLLLAQERCEKELLDKLLCAGYTEEQTEAILNYVKQYPYLNDVRYALHYFSCAGRKKSFLQMQFELRRKGVKDEDIHSAYEIYLAERREEELTSTPDFSEPDIAANREADGKDSVFAGNSFEGVPWERHDAEQSTLRNLMVKKLKGRTPDAEEREKLFAYFVRKGFCSEDIRKVMRECL